MDTLLQDVRYALRTLLRAPAFAVVAVLTLALGIGANTAIFSVVNAVLLRSLPFANAGELVRIYTAYPDDETRYPLSPPDFMSFHDDARSFSGVTAVQRSEETLTGTGEPTTVRVGRVAAGFLDVLGVAPVLGRGFHPDENQPDRNTAVLLSHAYWRTHFGGEPGVIGRTLTLNGVTREVVGVLPAGFDFPAESHLYYPLAYNETYSSTTAQGRRSESLQVVARLRPGVGLTEAHAEAASITQRLREEFPQTNSANISLALVPLRELLLGDVRRPLLILLGAVGLVLLIACVNVANLLLARGATRRGELAVRTALGAERGRLVRQLLTESVLLGLAGGVLGLLLAVWGVEALVAARPEGIPRLEQVRIDPAVIGFTALVSVATGLLFGLLPALQAGRSDIAATLRAGGRGMMGAGAANRARRALVVAEMAFAVILLVGSGLLIRSFLELTRVDPGFRSERLVSLQLFLPTSSYEGGAPVGQFYQELLRRVSALPGVEAAAAGSELPLSGGGRIFGFDIENQEPPPAGFVQDAAVAIVTPGYFGVLGIPLREGRLLDERDRFDAPDAVVVNQAFVRRFLSDGEPVGRRITFDEENWAEIVGVVGDVPQHSLDQDVRPAVYVPHEQFTVRAMRVVARTAGDPLALTGALRRTVREMDANLPVERFTTGDQLVAESVAQPRFYTVLLGIFAAVALVLAAVGIFGVMSFLVTQRTREIGVRLALGATPADVLRQVVGGAMAMAGVGVTLGVLLALLGSRILSGLLYGVGTLDPVAFAAAALVLLAVALLAALLPARAATRVDPNIALRFD